MSTRQTWQTSSDNSAATEQLGEHLGQVLKGSEVIELISDLGGGKTTLVRGLARGLGSKDVVTSPTFKISNVYRGKNLTLYHYDFYRLPNAGLMAHELHDALDDSKGVVVIEWGKVVNRVLPDKKLTIEIQQNAIGERKITLSYPNELAYILEKT